MRRIHLSTESWPDHPALDTGVSHALVRAVGDGTQAETVRLHRTRPMVAFGRQDTMNPGYADAVAASRAKGFLPIERLAGGRAAVFHAETLAFSWALPAPEPRAGIEARFRLIAEIVTEALVSLGIDARIGEVAGEYCPGRFSVNAGGRTKIMGVGQRLVRRAAHIGGVIVAGDAQSIKDVLIPVYAALGISWRPESVGSVSAETDGAGIEDVERAVRTAFERRFEIVPTVLPTAVVEAGRELAAGHLAEPVRPEDATRSLEAPGPNP